MAAGVAMMLMMLAEENARRRRCSLCGSDNYVSPLETSTYPVGDLKYIHGLDIEEEVARMRKAEEEARNVRS